MQKASYGNPWLSEIMYEWQNCHWPFQEPKLEVTTIYKADFSGLNFREYPQQNMAFFFGTFTYLHLLDPGDLPLNKWI